MSIVLARLKRASEKPKPKQTSILTPAIIIITSNSRGAVDREFVYIELGNLSPPTAQQQQTDSIKRHAMEQHLNERIY